jgi:hypothetical protein
LVVAVSVLVGNQATSAAEQSTPIRVLAYYYIWFDPTSWSRAKTDFPLLGRYSSDERMVMQQHVSWAKKAGISGFIVSWKSTPTLDRRLARLVTIATTSRFKLAIIYQGLDFERRPLPVSRIADDLVKFVHRYRKNPVFQVFGRKPLVIWSGSWKFTRGQIARVHRELRRGIYLLASERNADDYDRVADLFDGDAYYWSSVNPSTYRDYPNKLVIMGAAVHARRGLWIAPTAPGFDARLIGGKTVVDRGDGTTFRREFAGALASSPDAIGVISWNEFSESTQIEPSVRYRDRYLSLLARVLGGRAPAVGGFSSEGRSATGTQFGLVVIGVLVLVVACAMMVVFQRGRFGAGRPGGRSSDSSGSRT